MAKVSTKSYVKEVQVVIDLGYSERDVVKIFEGVVDHFVSIVGGVEPEHYHERVLNLRKEERAFYREQLEQGIAWAGYDGLTWRDVKFEPTRVKRCEQCMNWFYDTSRNGKKLTCDRFGEYKRFDFTNREFVYRYKDGDKLSVCGAKYEQARNPSTRNVQEVLFDAQPSGDDVMGNVMLDEIEGAYQEQINPYQTEWKYWNR